MMKKTGHVIEITETIKETLCTAWKEFDWWLCNYFF